MWMPYITVENVDETVVKIESLGGSIVAPPMAIPVPNGPRLSVIQDPSGVTLGVISYVAEPETSVSA